jgi:hypothetical protein
MQSVSQSSNQTATSFTHWEYSVREFKENVLLALLELVTRDGLAVVGQFKVLNPPSEYPRIL